MKTKAEVFQETIKDLGFYNAKPSQMTNSDLWMCTCEAMERYAKLVSSSNDIHNVMPSLIWEISKEIVKRQKYCYNQQPSTEAFSWEGVESEWFDWINEKLNGQQD